jgi:hypothetical protein
MIRILEAQKHVDPVDPDPEHCKKTKKNVFQSLFLHYYCLNLRYYNKSQK